MSMAQGRRLTKDFAYSEVKQKIIYGELKPDQIVREEQLAKLLEISRTPLRQAIQMLEMEEFLVRQPNGRLKVASFIKEEVEEIFMIRSMLEGEIAKSAARNATRKDVKVLNEILSNIRRSFQLGDSQVFVSYGNQFHDYLADISNLKTTVKLLSMVKDHANRYCRLMSIYGKWNEEADEEHDLILQCVRNNDGEAAEKAMKSHISSSLKAVIDRIEEKERNGEKWA
ncbi:GntR family transcriptional regulator [Gracilibacillus oryzae]|uniref:GntR family transcriptional regulator n=1 Tax=Gracilibacillus oryzae TaxID=1672701 RepID=A0A7C8L4M9_9BACI|nr:GntR family transcriptional regulator [Gracilibacillus oryzae]KAB8126649.1 GntR family transcriptional regulator [Gracilibacillus oryzae]